MKADLTGANPGSPKSVRPGKAALGRQRSAIRRLSVLAVLLLGGTLAQAVPALAQSPAAPLPAVLVAKVTSEVLDQSETFNGRLVAKQKVDLRARVSGFVEERPFTEGATVAAGDVLFQLERAPYQASLTEIEGQIKSIEAEKTLADLEVARQTELLKRNTVSQAQVDAVVAQAGKIDGQLLQLQGSEQRANLDLSYTTIAAPFAGRVGLAAVDVGDYVDASSGSLATLASVDPILVQLSVAQSVLLDYKARQDAGDFAGPPAATLTLGNGEAYNEQGKLAFIDVAVSQSTDSVTLRYEFANPEGRLLDGQLVLVRLSAEAAEPVLTVPLQALQRDQTGTFVMVVGDDGTAARREVTVSRREGTVAAVASGLAEGERVIIGGLNKVRPGIKVDAAEATAVPPAATATPAK